MVSVKRVLALLVVLIATCSLAGVGAPTAVGTPFGFSSVGFSATEAPAGRVGAAGHVLGAPDVQAGSHPWELTTSFVMTTAKNQYGEAIPAGDLRDLSVELPPGLIGNATVIPQCTIKQFETLPSGFRPFSLSSEFFPGEFLLSSYEFAGDSCPPDTQVGTLDYRTRNGGGLGDQYFGVYNLVPPPGVPAEFGSSPLKIPVTFKPTVRSGGDYGLTVTSNNINQIDRLGASTVTFWGVPDDASHDPLRGECLGEAGLSLQEFPHQCGVEGVPKPFLTMPTSCSSHPLTVTFRGDSWPAAPEDAEGRPKEAPLSSYVSQSATAQAHLPAMTGCRNEAFSPKITLAPDTAQADTPAGLTAEVGTTQEGLLSAGRESVAPADIENTTAMLPSGMAINPGQAAGLVACQPGEAGLGSEAPVACPAASRVGTVEIETPLLRDKLTGNVYVLPDNPPRLRLLIAASADGVGLKLIADVHLDQVTGRITTTLTETPPLPFTDFKLSFNGGARAALVTPPTCGLYSTSTDFTPWSSPFEADVSSTGSFGIETGPGGSGPAGCSGPLQFAPVLTAGSTTDQAGGSTDFSLLLQRADGQQRISSLQFKTPPGLLGRIGGVPLCPEPLASQGTCSRASQIGHTVVTAGPGGYPLVVPEPDQPPAPIYLTGGYRGAPYGLSIAVPVIAGPFDLGTVVSRASIAVDPRTAQLTITTDALPSILDGIPTDLRTINAVVDRPGFMFNPTNCDPQSFSGTALSTEGATAAISTPFQVGSCRSLPFGPKLTARTQARTSRKNGASLEVKLVQGAGDANIHSVKVDLPKQLPSRLTTLQKACLAATFEANPANCPAASVIGTAKAITPVLPVPVMGPVYFVSHGGEAFPSLIVVLQGYGVTVDLVGATFISKTGITSSTFKTVPDVPVSTFQLTIPEGPFSALAANGNLCKSKLAMPTVFTAQNGAQLKSSTRITVSGCPEAKKIAKPKKTATHAKKAKNSNRRAK